MEEKIKKRDTRTRTRSVVMRSEENSTTGNRSSIFSKLKEKKEKKKEKKIIERYSTLRLKDPLSKMISDPRLSEETLESSTESRESMLLKENDLLKESLIRMKRLFNDNFERQKEIELELKSITLKLLSEARIVEETKKSNLLLQYSLQKKRGRNFIFEAGIEKEK